MADPDIAQQWKSFTPERRNALLGKMTPEQKKKLRSTLETGTAPPVAAQPQTPGFFKRLAQGTGVPSSAEELKALQPSATETAINLVAPGIQQAAKAVSSYGKGLYGEGKKATGEAVEASRNIAQGGPVGANIGKAAAGANEFLLRGVLGPFGGAPVQAFGEDVH